MHLNAFYDLTTHTYTDALIQSVHCKNEFGAFCDIVDRHEVLEGKKNVTLVTAAIVLTTTWHM